MKAFLHDYKAALLGAVFILGLLLVAGLAQGSTPATHHRTGTKTVRWEGEINYTMLKRARNDLIDAAGHDKIKTLRVLITSPGGNAIMSLELARLVRDLSERSGLIVEIHAESLCASGCTFVLAAGTPGHRFISQWALFLVHPPQGENGCMAYVPDATTPNDKITNTLLVLMVANYVRYTGRPQAEVEQWATCGNEQVGTGALAVTMGIADAVE